MPATQRTVDIREDRGDSIFTRSFDPLRGCKTGEVIQPQPTSMRRTLLILLIGLAIGAFGVQVVKPWQVRYVAHFKQMQAIDQAAAIQGWLGYLSIFVLLTVAFFAVLVARELYHGWRALRAGHWPLAGAKVSRRTAVVKGWCLYLRCGVLPLLLFGSVVTLEVLSLRVLQIFGDASLRVQQDYRHALKSTPAPGSNARKPQS